MQSKKAKRGHYADGRHLMRYLKKKAGLTPEEIAKQEHVSARAVYLSIREIEAYESKNSEGQLQLAVRDLVISAVPQAKETLNGLLRATELVEVKNHKTGQMENVEMEDKVTRLEALKVVGTIAASLQPKVPGVAVQVNQNNTPISLGKSETMEERLRRLRAQADAHNLLPAEVAAVPESIDRGDEDDFGEDEDEDE